MRELKPNNKSYEQRSKSVHQTLRGNTSIATVEPIRNCSTDGDNDNEDNPQYFSMPSDVFSMTSLSKLASGPFLYSLFFISAKLTFYTLILWEIFHKSVCFPKDMPNIVKFTQLVMLPVTVIVTDEGVLGALFVYWHLAYYEGRMLEQHCLGTRGIYVGSNLARFGDALLVSRS